MPSFVMEGCCGRDAKSSGQRIKTQAHGLASVERTLRRAIRCADSRIRGPICVLSKAVAPGTSKGLKSPTPALLIGLIALALYSSGCRHNTERTQSLASPPYVAALPNASHR